MVKKEPFVSGLPGPDFEKPPQTAAGIIGQLKHPVNRRDRQRSMERAEMRRRYGDVNDPKNDERSRQSAKEWRRRYGD